MVIKKTTPGLMSGTMLIIATVIGGGCSHCRLLWLAYGFQAHQLF